MERKKVVYRFVNHHKQQNVGPAFAKAKELFQKLVKVEVVKVTELMEDWMTWKLSSTQHLNDEVEGYLTKGSQTTKPTNMSSSGNAASTSIGRTDE